MKLKSQFNLLPKSLRSTLTNAFALMTVIPLLVVTYYLYEYSFEELMQYQSTTLVLMIVVFIAILGFWLIYRVIQALIELASQADSIQKTGDLNDINYDEENEIGTIVNSFNTVMLRLRDKILELEKVNEQLQILSVTDELTGLYNFRSFKDFLTKEVSRSNRKEYSLTLVMIDIDNFKELNDKYGHFAGNECLKAVSSMIKESVRRYDIVARYGGDEFSIILPETNIDEGEIVATRLQEEFESTKIKLPMGDSVTMSISLGLASVTCSKSAPISQVKIIEASDEALYRAKSKGRGHLEKFRLAS